MSSKKTKASGKFVVRISPELHETLRATAESQSTSLNEVVKSMLAGPPQEGLDFSVLQETLGHSFLGVIQYGSTVRGESTSQSDIDWLIVLCPPTKVLRKLYSMWDTHIAQYFDAKVSPHFAVLPSDLKNISSLWLEAGLEGHILADQTGKIRKTQYQIRDLIATGFYKREYTHGHPYWLREEHLAK